MTAPSGLGIFVWQFTACEGGNLAAIIAKAKRCGVSWLAFHMDDHLTQDVVAKVHASGLYVACWSYCVPGLAETQAWIHAAVHFRALGVDAVLPDAETEWEARKGPDGLLHPADRRPEAIVFAKQLRDALGPDVFIGNCGAWQWPNRHPVYPDHAFGAQWDAGMPERYWTMFSPSVSPENALWESEHEWTDRINGDAYKAIMPLGSAFDGSDHGGQKLNVEDVLAFLVRPATLKDGAWALWSWQHIPAAVWAALEEKRAKQEATTDPDVTANCAVVEDMGDAPAGDDPPMPDGAA